MSESFAELFNESLNKQNIKSGSIVTGKIIDIDSDYVIIDAGLKSEGFVPISQFKNESNELEVQIGDEVEVALDAIENGWGETKLSREKAKRAKAWEDLIRAYEAHETIRGFVSDKVKGGFTVEIGSIKAFLPGSLVDTRSTKEVVDIEGKELDFKVIKIDQKRNNVVVSRRSINIENSAEREAVLQALEEGKEVKGVVKNLTDYGAFIDLGGVDGLLHITDMSWRRVKHPSDVVKVGQEIQVKVLKFEKDKSRVSLGLKQLGSDPWVDITKRYPIGSKLVGQVTNITDYGCFVEIEEGVEGLVHVSEMDWTNKNIHPTKVVQMDMKVEVMVLEIDEERRRISLGLKQCTDNPWDAFAVKHNKGDKIAGKIKSITDFGIFLGLEGGIDGLIHLSDISWEDSSEEILREYKKGQELEALVLAIDAERERISLGIKQLNQDPYLSYIEQYSKNSIVRGIVTEVDVKGAVVQLAEGVDGLLRATEMKNDKVEDARTHLNEKDEIEAKIINFDKKNRTIMLSIKAKDMQEEEEAIKELNRSSEEASGTKFGDLLKGKINDQDE